MHQKQTYLGAPRWRLSEWLNYFSTTAHAKAVASIFRTERFTNDPSTYPAIRQKGREIIQEVYALIEDTLEASGTQVGRRRLFYYRRCLSRRTVLWASRLNVEMEYTYPIYTAYVNRQAERESVKEARNIHLL